MLTFCRLLWALLGAASGSALVDVCHADGRLRADIRYATPDNFAHVTLYPVARCLVRPEVATLLRRAQDYLDLHNPGVHLLLKDCYRPLSVQRQLFQAVRGTRRQGYVADPNGPASAVHTYGAAVDATLEDPAGHEIDMGTPFDFLGPLAEPRREEHYLALHQLTSEQLVHRHWLRAAMLSAGFKGIRNEWWHFDAWRGAALQTRYTRLDVPLESIP